MADGKLFRVSKWLIPLARRLLYCWVRTSVFREDASRLIDPEKPVCYVLQDRHLSNLLILVEETRRRGLPPAETRVAADRPGLAPAFFFLNRDDALLGRRREHPRASSLLSQLIRVVTTDPPFDVQLVPVVVLWGRSPGQQDSVLQALFSETWRPPGLWRQFFAILVHGRHVLVRFNSPISLRDVLQGGLDEVQALRKVSRVFRVHFRRQRQMAIGPDLSHRNTQVSAVLASADVRLAIAQEATSNGLSPSAARARAADFALEIASDYSYGVVRALEILLNWLWTRLYDGISVHHFDSVARIASGHEIVYVPCHRSHIDYLLLSYLIHRHGLTPPHIAAGANLNLPIIGPLLRRGGAFFIRRSFKGQALYAAVFDAYLHLMLVRGFPIEYFIEGGRSRSGRMLQPKAGILGMTVRSYLRHHTRPLVFVPTYIGYEKVIEGRTYVDELAGQPKQHESLLGLLRSVRSLKRVFGRVQVSFGEPLVLADLLDQQNAGWRGSGVGQPDLERRATRRLAVELAKRINEAAVINPVNLIGLALLATPKHTADEGALRRLIGHYQTLHSQVPYAPKTIGCELEAHQVVAYGERLALIERLRDPLGDLIRVPADQAPLLAYCRNNVVHLFALPAILACLLSHHHELDYPRVRHAVNGIFRLMRAELFLRWTESELDDVLARVVDVLVARTLVRRRAVDGSLAAPEPVCPEFSDLHLLGETIRPLLERHFLTLALLQRHGSGELTRQALADHCQLLAQRLSRLYDFNAPDSPEKATFATIIEDLIERDFLSEDEAGRLHFDQRLLFPLADAELVLSLDARQSIQRVARTTGG